MGNLLNRSKITSHSSHSIQIRPSHKTAMAQNRGCLVCCSVISHSVEETLKQMQQAKVDGADIVEIRIDFLKNFNPKADLAILLKERPLPIIITYRPKWEGGEYEGDEATRLDVLRLAIELDADYVDVELQVATDFMKSTHDKKSRMCKIIVSNHNSKSTPSVEELGHLVARLQSTGADIVKFTTTATNVTDVARIFQVFSHSKVPIIASASSARGLISSILCPKFGGYLSFGSLGARKESTSGQQALTDIINIYRIKNLGKATKVFGIIGNPVGHNKGPILHNQAFREIGLDAVYVPFLVDDLVDFLRVYSSPDFAGFRSERSYRGGFMQDMPREFQHINKWYSKWIDECERVNNSG